MKNTYYYVGANNTVDIILVSPDKEVLMIRRASTAQACPDMLAFPGGFVDTEAKKGEAWKSGLETAEQAAWRELKEETGLEILNPTALKHVGVFEFNNRDPRDNDVSWSRSEAFLYQLNQDEFSAIKGKEKGMDDASAAYWIPLDELKNQKLAFDHNDILEKAENLLIKKKIGMKR